MRMLINYYNFQPSILYNMSTSGGRIIRVYRDITGPGLQNSQNSDNEMFRFFQHEPDGNWFILAYVTF
ncbi:hypothetical protein C900_03032 [Fulvivirga imtechensis AK7]|uniref:Uncharacterized protein n=1 Tax=Fulvivirga imtechensis AK7 TaxID=1237149 RepID=L8JSR1_9BACT|nr:hypothetical protein C900_03032 [Fulvivirga imtechensis AK7]